jgi:hypothetical protein
MPAIIRSIPGGRPSACDGLVGYPFLSNFIVTIDYRNRTLRLIPPPQSDAVNR